MNTYQLDYILHEPTENEGWMYHAEIPAIQGCRAWGDTPEETLRELADVARMMIEVLIEDGEPLPQALIPSSNYRGNLTVTV